MGGFFVQGVFQRDYGLIMGVVLFYAFAIAVMNLVVDLLICRNRPKDPLQLGGWYMNQWPRTEDRVDRGRHYGTGGVPWKQALGRSLRNKLAVSGTLVILLLGIAAIAAPVLPLKDPARQDLDATLASPSPGRPLGTDVLGRDSLSRLIHGARTSPAVGVLAQLIVLAVGIPIGLVASYAGGRTDNLLMGGVDIVFAFPDLLLIILLRVVFGGSIYMMFLAIGLASWAVIARLVRGQVLSLREQEFVLAARATGARATTLSCITCCQTASVR